MPGMMFRPVALEIVQLAYQSRNDIIYTQIGLGRGENPLFDGEHAGAVLCARPG